MSNPNVTGTSSLHLTFPGVKYVEGGGLFKPKDPREQQLWAYKRPEGTIFLNRAFGHFLLQALKALAIKSSGALVSLRKLQWRSFNGQSYT